MIHTIKWFKNRINKRIFRDDNKCSCIDCKDTLDNGLIISDENHAESLYWCQNDYANEGILLNYRDKYETK